VVGAFLLADGERFMICKKKSQKLKCENVYKVLLDCYRNSAGKKRHG
jgi:hypothetical protein